LATFALGLDDVENDLLPENLVVDFFAADSSFAFFLANDDDVEDDGDFLDDVAFLLLDFGVVSLLPNVPLMEEDLAAAADAGEEPLALLSFFFFGSFAISAVVAIRMRGAMVLGEWSRVGQWREERENEEK
jgi:hypothetical protein